MGVTATTRLPAGWYPDPDGDNRRRWWDGREWTQYTADFQRPAPIDEPEAVVEEQVEQRHVIGTRIGRWLAGVASVAPAIRRSKRRRAHRSAR
jgi:hypothetical protein